MEDAESTQGGAALQTVVKALTLVQTRWRRTNPLGAASINLHCLRISPHRACHRACQ